MLYATVFPHPLLTAKAVAKGSPLIDAHQELAEALFGLVPPILTDALSLERVGIALAEQINFQVEQGIDPLVASYQSSAHSRQQMAFRDAYLSPRAVAILDLIPGLGKTAGAYDVMTSHRTP